SRTWSRRSWAPRSWPGPRDARDDRVQRDRPPVSAHRARRRRPTDRIAVRRCRDRNRPRLHEPGLRSPGRQRTLRPARPDPGPWTAPDKPLRDGRYRSRTRSHFAAGIAHRGPLLCTAAGRDTTRGILATRVTLHTRW